VNDYDALRDYLKKQKLPEFVLTFQQIEEIIDAPLPRPRDFDMEGRHEFQSITRRIRALIFGSRGARAA